MPEAVNIQGNLHVDRYLTNYSERYTQSATNFVANVATTVIPVMNQSDIYTIYPRGYFWRDEAEHRPLGGRPVQVGYKVESASYLAHEYALEHWIDDRQRANSDPVHNLDENAVELLQQKMMIKKDRTWATKFFTTGQWTTEFEGVTSGPSSTEFLQFEQTASDPVAKFREWFETMAESTGYAPNTLVLGSKVARILMDQDDIVERIKYTQTGIASLGILASMLGVDRVVTPRSIYNSAAEGATDNFSFIVDKRSFWLGYIAPTAALNTPTALATFAWTGLADGMGTAMGGVISRGRDERAYSDWIHSRMAWDMRIVSQDLGMFFLNAVAA